MTRLSEVETADAPHWDSMYHAGTPPWDTGRASAELIRVVEAGLLKPGPTLEIGCGTGADAIYLARQGFEVTAVDSSPIALERARARREFGEEAVRFVLDDVFKFAPTAGEFELVYDAGFYHFIRQTELDRYLDLLWRITYPGSYCLALVGSTGERAEGGPPQVSKDEIYDELGRLFDFVHLRRFTFESPLRKQGYKGWSCLMQRPAVGS